jgi:Flp pilus assembly pilin Flp
MRYLRSLIRGESGQDLAEYAIALAIIAIGVGLISAAIGGQVNLLWSNSQPSLEFVTSNE